VCSKGSHWAFLAVGIRSEGSFGWEGEKRISACLRKKLTLAQRGRRAQGNVANESNDLASDRAVVGFRGREN